MGVPAFATAWLADAYAVSGDYARAKSELEETRALSFNGEVTPFNLALFSPGEGDHARAIGYVELAYASDSQWLVWLKNDRALDPLRAGPRFSALMTKLGFGE